MSTGVRRCMYVCNYACACGKGHTSMCAEKCVRMRMAMCLWCVCVCTCGRAPMHAHVCVQEVGSGGLGLVLVERFRSTVAEPALAPLFWRRPSTACRTSLGASSAASPTNDCFMCRRLAGSVGPPWVHGACQHMRLTPTCSGHVTQIRGCMLGRVGIGGGAVGYRQV